MSSIHEDSESAGMESLNSAIDPVSGSSYSRTPRPKQSPKSKLSKGNTLNGLKNSDIEKNVFEWVKGQLPVHVSSTQIRDKARELYRLGGYKNLKCSYGWYRRWSKRFKRCSGCHEDSDPVLIIWLLQQLDNNKNVTHMELQNFAKDKMKNRNPKFRGSAGWSSRFFKRHHILLNWDGHYELPLPHPLDDQVQQFLARDSIRNLRFGNGSVGCMDEIPLSFTSGNMEIERLTGSQDRLRKSTIKDCEATVILAFLQTGLLLPPMIIVKSQNTANLNQVYTKCENPVVVFYAETCEPSVRSLEKWIDLIWTKNVEQNQPSLLLCDSYEIHENILEKFQDIRTSLEIFPPGTGCKLQPLDVFAKRAFFKGVQDEWTKYMKTQKTDTKINLPSNNDIVDWVYSTFLVLKNREEELKKSFSVTGFLT